jgi:hypothetical protein
MTKENGNILFLILIAVALFAALSYAVTSTSRSGEGGISADKAKLAATELMQYATQMSQAVNRLRVINGCTPTQISFERDPFDGSDTQYLNPNAPSDKRCHVFHSKGGGMYEKKFDFLNNSGIPMYVSGNEGARQIGTDELADLYIRFQAADVTQMQQICSIINEKMSIQADDPSTVRFDPYKDGNFASTAFKGSYGDVSILSVSGFDGKLSYCAGHNVTSLSFYHVLIAR